MKETKLTTTCSCGFWKQRVFYTNEYGYFEIPAAYCPDCFNLLCWSASQLPVDVIETGIDLSMSDGLDADARPTFSNLTIQKEKQ